MNKDQESYDHNVTISVKNDKQYDKLIDTLNKSRTVIQLYDPDTKEYEVAFDGILPIYG